LEINITSKINDKFTKKQSQKWEKQKKKAGKYDLKKNPELNKMEKS
jgi:hypothetical protein